MSSRKKYCTSSCFDLLLQISHDLDEWELSQTCCIADHSWSSIPGWPCIDPLTLQGLTLGLQKEVVLLSQFQGCPKAQNHLKGQRISPCRGIITCDVLHHHSNLVSFLPSVAGEVHQVTKPTCASQSAIPLRCTLGLSGLCGS